MEALRKSKTPNTRKIITDETEHKEANELNLSKKTMSKYEKTMANAAESPTRLKTT